MEILHCYVSLPARMSKEKATNPEISVAGRRCARRACSRSAGRSPLDQDVQRKGET